MQATKQQQILGYFIEEAKEHLDTIESGLLDLQATMADQERLNELFRAAHSVKGGAAMLGFNSIQKVSHHLEDCFKMLKEHPVKIDQNLENLFFKGFDILKDLVEGLQSPYGLREEDAVQTVQAAEPTFIELQNYLNGLTQKGASAAPAQPVATPAASPELTAKVNGALKMMLQLFKQGDSTANRQQLTTLCTRMAPLSPSSEWRELLKVAQWALANPKATYPTLAPLLIKELKQASDLLIAGKAQAICASQALRQFAPASKPAAPAAVAQPAPVAAPAPRDTGKQQITIPAEPRAAARALLDAFNKQQLIEIADFLMRAIQ
mgnify:CR=1 FL=1